MFLPVNWGISYSYTCHLRLPSWTPARQPTKDIDVSHRHDPTKGDAPYKSFKDDWIPTDAVSRAWPASWNKIQKGMFISSSYHFLHLTVLPWCIWFMRFSARPAKYIMYVHQLQTHFLQYICTVYFIALSLSCDIRPALFHQHSRHRNPHHSASNVQSQAITLIYKNLPLSSVAWTFHFHLIDMSFFHKESAARASYLVIVHTYDKAGPYLVRHHISRP